MYNVKMIIDEYADYIEAINNINADSSLSLKMRNRALREVNNSYPHKEKKYNLTEDYGTNITKNYNFQEELTVAYTGKQNSKDKSGYYIGFEPENYRGISCSVRVPILKLRYNHLIKNAKKGDRVLVSGNAVFCRRYREFEIQMINDLSFRMTLL